MTSYQKQETQSLLQNKHVHHGDKPLSMTHFCESEDFDAHLRRQCYNCNVARLLTLGVLAMFCLTGLFIGTVVVRQSPDDDSAKNQVQVGPDGTYMVHYDTTDIHPETTSFGALAAIMLPPWYEASLLAIHDHLADRDELDPSKVQSCRKVLLMTRDLLDVFAPVFATTNRRGTLKLWKQLRGYYKEGYEKVGYLQDLDHSGVDYSHELLQERIFAVLQWRDEFAKFVHSHNIRFLLRHAAVDNSKTCHHYFEFKTSHLFWGDEEDGGVTDTHQIPCGTDLAVTSLRDLSSVQLTHAMQYWTTIQTYDSVLDESREEEFHNLRKQLRAYGDTNHLFDDVLWTTNNNTTTTNQTTTTTEATLDRAQHLLGQINDLWTAYHIYVTHDDETHHPASQQEQLALKIDRAWKEFQEWATTNDLTRVLQQAATSQQQQPVVTTSEQAAAADSDHA